MKTSKLRGLMGVGAVVALWALAADTRAEEGRLYGRRASAEATRLAAARSLALTSYLQDGALPPPAEELPLLAPALPQELQNEGAVPQAPSQYDFAPLQQPLIVQKGLIQKGAAYCPDYKISYHHHRGVLRRVKSCDPPVETVLAVPDPECESCLVQIPVCIPACCAAEQPKVSYKKGVLGRCHATFVWCCGYKVDVMFRCRGDVLVTTHGL